MYGKASRIYTEREKDSLFVTHVIELAGLLPGNCYYFVVNGTDQSGNSAESSEYNIYHFRTLKVFDIGIPSNPYPSISGTHNGTITTNQTIIATFTQQNLQLCYSHRLLSADSPY